MWRMPVAFVAGGLSWWLVGSIGVWVLVNNWPEYAALTRRLWYHLFSLGTLPVALIATERLLVGRMRS